MIRGLANAVCFTLLALIPVLLIGQNCLAQPGLCEADPCQGVPNAVAGTCSEIGGPCAGPSDYMCSCDPLYDWQGATHTCEGSQPTCVDADGDTYHATDPVDCPQGDDCDDSNADVYPGAPELCDDVDNQCPDDAGNGEIDEGCPSRAVFVTEFKHTGALGGLAGADAVCQAEADAAGLPGVFLAWLSNMSAGPDERFTHSDIPYVLLSGDRVADDWDDLADGSLQTVITVSPAGPLALAPTAKVWTNTLPDGTPHNAGDGPEDYCCNGWTWELGSGLSALIWFNAYPVWTYGPSTPCLGAHHLYCFQQ